MTVQSAVTEPRRLKRLAATALLDSPRDEAFDRLTRLAALTLRAPICLLTLVDGDRQFFKSTYGLPEPWASRRQTPLSHSFCQYVVARGAPVVVPDARADPEVAENRAIPEMGVAAYLGAPLRTEDGYVIGSFAAIDGKPRQWTSDEVGVITDFALVAMTEIELRNENARTAGNARRLDEIFASIPLGIVVVDADARVLLRNLAAHEIWQRPLEVGDQIGEYFAQRSFTLAGDPLPRDRWQLRRALRQRETIVDEEVAIIREDGQRRIVAVSAAPVSVESDRPHGAIVVLDDVTDRAKLEARLQNTARMEAVGRLAGGIAHDFNNILTVVTTHCEMIREEAGEGTQIADDASQVLAAADRAGALTRQLLTYSRSHVVQDSRFSISDALRQLEPMIRRLIPEDIDLVVSCKVGDDSVVADRASFEQAIMNLVGNARDAMPNGGKLTIAAEETSIQAGDSRLPLPPGSYARVTVRDNGIGMNEAVKAQIFDPFFTTKAPGEGTGLGLSTVAGFVSEIGGHIAVEAHPEQGTTFTMWIPSTPASAEGSAEAAVQEVVHAGGTILLVEDENDVRDAVCTMLQRLGYSVITAHNASDAVLQLEQGPSRVDLILTDVVMPHTGGKELGDWAAAVLPGTPVLFMSGYTEDEVLLRGIRRGEVAFIQKPFRSQQLSEAVAAAMREKG